MGGAFDLKQTNGHCVLFFLSHSHRGLGSWLSGREKKGQDSEPLSERQLQPEVLSGQGHTDTLRGLSLGVVRLVTQNAAFHSLENLNLEKVQL